MNKTTVITAVIMLGVGLGIGFWLSPDRAPSEMTAAKERKPLYYRNPMDPGITSSVPAKDYMGMDYVPVYADGGGDVDKVGTVRIDPVVVQNIGVRTQSALKKTFGRAIRAAGRIDFDEQKMARLHPKVEGWIEEIMVDKTGQSVSEDDILLSIYSPKLVSTQQEYLLALNNLAVLEDSPIDEIRLGARDLVRSARERLQLFDVPEHQIRELEASKKVKKNIHIHTPVSGTVIRIGARQGQYVTPGTELFMIVDLSQVWVYAGVYDYELPWIKEGDSVEMTLVSVPGTVFNGSLAYIYPYAEANTRTTKVRMVFDNPELLLRPDMLAEVVIHSDTRENVIVIPSEAVIRSGDRTQVFVKRGPGKFEPRLVELGVESGGQVAVLKGVAEGEEVVTSAQFLVDSESKLSEATAKMMETLNAEENGQVSPSMDHSNMDMGDMDHGDMDMGDMDHSKMNMGEMDHGGMNMGDMDHSNMDMGDMDHGDMDHSKMNMDDMDHGSHDDD